MLGFKLRACPIHGGFCDGVKIVRGHQSGDRFVVISANGLRTELAQSRGDFIGIGPVADDVAKAYGDVPTLLRGIEDSVECSGVRVQIAENENPHLSDIHEVTKSINEQACPCTAWRAAAGHTKRRA